MAKVAIIIGSDSDLPIVKKGLEILKSFKVKYEVKILSAHRTPKEVEEYLGTFEKSRIELVIAVAGKAAHLPGVVAAQTNVPVIGVPIKVDFDGMDALMSIVQMPKGIPVATVGVNAMENAAILAVRILSVKYPDLRTALDEYKEKMRQEVLAKDELVRDL